jgi:hypothetical protein
MHLFKKKIRKNFEVFLIKVAIKIVLDRNVQRSTVVSRRDNNTMFEMGWKLKSICERMLVEYDCDLNY